FERAVASIEEVLADPEVELVSICSPNFLHRDFAVRAAAAGKPFWIEKPMGVGAAQSREIAQAAAQARGGDGVATAVGFNYRHAPAIPHLRELVAAGRLGRITNVRCWLIADYASSPQGPLTWRYDRARGGSGVIGDLLSHGVDLVQHVTGQRLTEVSATTDVFIPDRPLPLGTGVGHGSDYDLEVFGTEGSARWSFTRMNEFEVMIGEGGSEHGYTTVLAGPGHGEYSRFQPGPGIPMSFDDLKVIEAAAFLSDAALG